jgi:hypothetical protein
MTSTRSTVLLVHGAFAEGSSWREVLHRALRGAGGPFIGIAGVVVVVLCRGRRSDRPGISPRGGSPRRVTCPL